MDNRAEKVDESMEGQSGLSELSLILWVSAIQGCPRGFTVITVCLDFLFFSLLKIFI